MTLIKSKALLSLIKQVVPLVKSSIAFIAWEAVLSPALDKLSARKNFSTGVARFRMVIMPWVELQVSTDCLETVHFSRQLHPIGQHELIICVF